jgi:hypothetical protein
MQGSRILPRHLEAFVIDVFFFLSTEKGLICYEAGDDNIPRGLHLMAEANYW